MTAHASREKQKWRIGQKMRAEELENLARMESKALLDTPA